MHKHLPINQPMYNLFRVSSILIVTSFLLTSCTSTRLVDWLFVVPENYQGWLAIRYDCPGGAPLDINQDPIRAVFNQTGVIGTSNTFVPTRGQIFVQSTSGQVIDSTAFDWDEQGYGFADDGHSGIYIGDTKYDLAMWYVGDKDYINSMKNATVYRTSRDAFLKAQFGIVRP